MNRVRAFLLREDSQALLLGDEFDVALVGVARRCGQPTLAVYDVEKLVAAVEAQGASEVEAIEHVEFNIIGAWHGKDTPLFFYTTSYLALDPDEEDEP